MMMLSQVPNPPAEALGTYLLCTACLLIILDRGKNFLFPPKPPEPSDQRPATQGELTELRAQITEVRTTVMNLSTDLRKEVRAEGDRILRQMKDLLDARGFHARDNDE